MAQPRRTKTINAVQQNFYYRVLTPNLEESKVKKIAKALDDNEIVKKWNSSASGKRVAFSLRRASLTD